MVRRCFQLSIQQVMVSGHWIVAAMNCLSDRQAAERRRSQHCSLKAIAQILMTDLLAFLFHATIHESWSCADLGSVYYRSACGAASKVD